ncbi:N-acetylmuramoyl-L-alanine amidase [Orenia marismortui]|uniref:N-acetylmuramoyl-L-alanine amidase n=1 Tax=Orenia marismortui TaxID=46469 RepID=UPI00037D054C|nr:N-acetylmuramoyl-L-alanine amidase [Orenia marismortui]
MVILCNKKFLSLFCSLLLLFFIIGSLINYIFKARPIAVFSRKDLIIAKSIVIDPGHGGIDRGTSYKGLIEKDINLDIARRLRSLLSKKGAKVIMTRYHDISLDHHNRAYKSRHKRDLKARVDIINNKRSDLFISIHVNYFPGKFRIRGPILFYQKGRNLSKLLAQKIQDRINQINYQGVQISQNNIRVGDYYILNNTKGLGVLVEVGFLNKKIDNWLLTETKFKDILVDSIYQGILDYYQK